MVYYACALTSGGKDGTLGAMLAQSRADAEVVCYANVCPSADAVDELDSHCFQTVGHRCVDALGALTGKDVYRRRLRGSSVSTAMAYEANDTDEVEDLRALLREARRREPRLNAVCSGAILSDYQRLRVEHVCAELGLTSLAPLWRMPQREVLERVVSSGIDARLVKVAAMGLSPEAHLGKSIADVSETLIRVEELYGSHCAGEGGEFETLVVDCPLYARGWLALTKTRVEKTSSDAFAPSGHLVVDEFEVVLKPGAEGVAPGRVIWVEDGEESDMSADEAATATVRPTFTFTEIESDNSGSASVVRVDDLDVLVTFKFAVNASARMYSMSFSAVTSTVDHATCAEAIFQRMGSALESEFGASSRDAWNRIAMTSVVLDDMSQFAKVNAVYAKYMPSSEPSARACVTSAPSGTRVYVDCVVDTSDAPRRSLHVQSISSWAPACIGPYGQAVSVGGLTYVAGQIGMEPSTLELAAGIEAQSLRATQHAVSVSLIAGAPLDARAISVTVYSNVKDIEEKTNALIVARDALDALFSSSVRAFSWKPLRVYIRAGDLPKRASCEILPVMIDGNGPGGDTDDDDDNDDACNVFSHTRGGERQSSDATESASVYRASKFMRCVVAARIPDDGGIVEMFENIIHHLDEAGLNVRDLAHCRMYRVAKTSARAPEKLFNALLSAARESAGIDAPFLIDSIPVHACGIDADVTADVVLEAYAVAQRV